MNTTIEQATRAAYAAVARHIENHTACHLLEIAHYSRAHARVLGASNNPPYREAIFNSPRPAIFALAQDMRRLGIRSYWQQPMYFPPPEPGVVDEVLAQMRGRL